MTDGWPCESNAMVAEFFGNVLTVSLEYRPAGRGFVAAASSVGGVTGGGGLLVARSDVSVRRLLL